VWGKSVEKSRAKLQDKMKTELPKVACDIGVRFGYDTEVGSHHLKKLLKRLETKQKENETVFVYGKGKRKTPVQIASGKKFAQVSAGETHTAALDSEGNLWTWGNNGFGQLGDGTTTSCRARRPRRAEGVAPYKYNEITKKWLIET